MYAPQLNVPRTKFWGTNCCPSYLRYQTVTRVSGVSPFSQVSVKHMTLHSQYSLCSLVSTASSSVLLGKDPMFTMMFNRRNAWLVLSLFSRHFASALYPLRLLHSSSGISSLSMGSSWGAHKATMNPLLPLLH